MTTSPVREGEVLAGEYRVERVLGIGGMGVVVAATHLDLLSRRRRLRPRRRAPTRRWSRCVSAVVTPASTAPRRPLVVASTATPPKANLAPKATASAGSDPFGKGRK